MAASGLAGKLTTKARRTRRGAKIFILFFCARC
jgi:hypothetical protein